MGGSVAVTLREPDGTDHRMCRWTNCLPYYVRNLKIVQKDPDHINNFLRQWERMREDYLLHKDDEQYEFPMTPAYAHYTLLAPYGYGLVVIDMQKERILDCQGYCSFDSEHGVHLANDNSFFPKYDRGDHDRLDAFKYEDEDEENVCYRWAQFFNEGRITKTTKWDKEKRKIVEVENFTSLTQAADNDVSEYEFHYDYSPFTITKFPEAPDGLEEMKRVIVEELGFVLSEEEEEQWEEEIRSMEE